MKKYFLSAACLCLCAGFLFVGCKKDDDGPETNVVSNKVTATVQSGSSVDVDAVKAFIDYYDSRYQVANSTYTNGGFTLTFPEIVDDQYLYQIEGGDGLKVSNPNAKIGEVYTDGYKSGYINGSFYYAAVTASSTKATIIAGSYVYANSDMTMTGSYSEKEDGYTSKEICNVSLKTGWNMWYIILTITEKSETWELTTTPQSNLKWVHSDGDGIEDLLKSSQSVSTFKFSSKFGGSSKLMIKGLK